jgi:putative restriction endonuclease
MPKYLDEPMRNEAARIEALGYYSNRFQRLRVDRAHGVAPHKPILLLSVIELISKEIIAQNQIYLLPELQDTFLKYWDFLGSDLHTPDISRPFFHMKSGKFWHLWANPGYEKILCSDVKLRNLAEVKTVIKYAYLDEDLFEFLQEPLSCSSLVAVLVGRWFPGRLEEVQKISRER